MHFQYSFRGISFHTVFRNIVPSPQCNEFRLKSQSCSINNVFCILYHFRIILFRFFRIHLSQKSLSHSFRKDGSIRSVEIRSILDTVFQIVYDLLVTFFCSRTWWKIGGKHFMNILRSNSFSNCCDNGKRAPVSCHPKHHESTEYLSLCSQLSIFGIVNFSFSL